MIVLIVTSFGLAVACAAVAVSNLPSRYPAPTLARLVLGACALTSGSAGMILVLGNEDNAISRVEAIVFLLGSISTAVFLFLCGLYLTKLTPETHVAYRPTISQEEAEMTAKMARIAGLGLMALSPIALLYMIWLAFYG